MRVSGLLSAYLDLFHSGRIPDLHIVPISISYERVLEENLYAYEMLGTPKPPESTGVGHWDRLRLPGHRVRSPVHGVRSGGLPRLIRVGQQSWLLYSSAGSLLIGPQ